ncbi:MAG: DUF3263 domain-containing protein [Rhodococcus sp. (in: high G+C Gram-positive bacteria)]|uniref:DUF3263 domain-containing protein n=1 Tax=Rhodococcus sp. TaxID=1831 RepID=UPI003BAF09A8
MRPQDRTNYVLTACKWLPYGGVPAEEIFLTFGLSPMRYYTRLHRMIETGAVGPIPTNLRDQLLNLCRTASHAATRSLVSHVSDRSD